MALSRLLMRVGVGVAAVLALPTLGLDRSGARLVIGEAAAQEATTTYLDDLLTRARDLLTGRFADPELAVGILEELVDAGSVEAAFELAGYYVTNPEDPANLERARILLENLTTANDEDAARAWAMLADVYIAEGPMRDWSKARDAYRHAADLGDTSAMISLAAMLASPEGLDEPPDADAATELLSAVIAVGDTNAPRAWYGLGTLHHGAGDFVGALAAYRSAVDLGNTPAMVQLASMLGRGEGVDAPDLDAAKDLLQRVTSGDPENAAWAWSVLAELQTGSGNPSEAVEAYRQAADLGDTSAMISLAAMLAAGEGVGTPETDRAIEVLSRAAGIGDQNAARAWSALAGLYRATGDLALTLEANRQAADLGDTTAMINYATMAAAGEGMAAPDLGAARTYLDRAIAAGDANVAWAWSVLADVSLRDGEGHDPAQAIEAYRQAADLGDTWSMIGLALVLASGEGAPAPDVPAAIALLTRALDANDANATRAASELGRLYREVGDLAKAVDAYARAAEGGSTTAMINLATMVAAGEGIAAPDLVRARALLEEAVGIDDANAGWAWGELAELVLTEGANRDPARAREALAQAAERGDTAAMIDLAGLLASGEGGDAPAVRPAIELLTRAAEANDANAPRAWNALAQLYLQSGEHQRALEYFELLAATGDGHAHLAAAEIIGLNPGSPAARESLVAHFREAAQLIGSREIAQAMLRINSVALYAVVQALLVEAGYEPGGVDGRFGPRTEQALTQFCADRRLTDCLPSIVTLGLLTELLGLPQKLGQVTQD